MPAEAAGPRIAAVNELTPQQLFTLYADQQGLAPEAAAVGCATGFCALHPASAVNFDEPNSLCAVTALLLPLVPMTKPRGRTAAILVEPRC